MSFINTRSISHILPLFPMGNLFVYRLDKTGRISIHCLSMVLLALSGLDFRFLITFLKGLSLGYFCIDICFCILLSSFSKIIFFLTSNYFFCYFFNMLSLLFQSYSFYPAFLFVEGVITSLTSNHFKYDYISIL